jgi:hypothetical protein
MTAEEAKQIKAEATFLRAVYHWKQPKCGKIFRIWTKASATPTEIIT